MLQVPAKKSRFISGLILIDNLPVAFKGNIADGRFGKSSMMVDYISTNHRQLTCYGSHQNRFSRTVWTEDYPVLMGFNFPAGMRKDEPVSYPDGDVLERNKWFFDGLCLFHVIWSPRE
jgi:hypothetical protein